MCAHPVVCQHFSKYYFELQRKALFSPRVCSIHPLAGFSDMDSPSSEDYVVLAPGRPEPLVSLQWKEPESNGLDVCRWDTTNVSVFIVVSLVVVVIVSIGYTSFKQAG